MAKVSLCLARVLTGKELSKQASRIRDWKKDDEKNGKL
jgi:hypothetical protein